MTQTHDPGADGLVTYTKYEAPFPTTYLRRIARTLPLGNTTTYSHWGDTETATHPCNGGSAVSQAGLLRQTTGPDPTGSQTAQVWEYRYDSAGRTVGVHRNSETGWSCTTHDNRGRPTSQTWPAFGSETARTITYNHAVGNDPLVTSVSDTAGTVTTRVDLLGRTQSTTDVWGKTYTSTYDQAGRLTQQTGPAGTDAWTKDSYSYDAAGRVDIVKLNNLVIADPPYTSAGELSSVSYPSGTGNGANGTSLSGIGRDPSGRLTSLTWSLAGGG